MTILSKITQLIKNFIFGENANEILEKKIFFLINFLTMLIAFVGMITNLFMGLSLWSNTANVITLIVIYYINSKSKKVDNYAKYVNILFVTSVILLSIAWFTNGGYDGSIPMLIFVFSIAIYTIVNDNLKFTVFVTFLLMFISLNTFQFYYPDLVVKYNNQEQRIVDLVIGGGIYFFFIYYIFKIVLDIYKKENVLIEKINKELILKNNEIQENAQKIIESEEKYKNLFDTMPSGFYKSSPEGYFLDANPAFIKMLGYNDLEELKQIHIPSTLYVHESERNDILEHLLEFNSQIEIYRLKKKDGSIIWVEENPRYIRDELNNIISHEGICKDITERIENEIELNKSRKQLLELNATKDKFFSIIAHDLRNPLGSFNEIIRIMTDDYDSFEEDERKVILESIKKSSTHVYNLLENLLQWSMSQRGLIIFNPTLLNLKIIVEISLEVFALAIANKNINVNVKLNNSTFIFTDSNLINFVIRNIISNAVKFTKSSGQIDIGICQKEDLDIDILERLDYNEDKIVLFIKDNGLGIPKEKLNEIFKVEQNYTTLGTSGEKGSGLGLVLVKEFIEKNGCKLWIDSEENVGTTVFFTINKSLEVY